MKKGGAKKGGRGGDGGEENWRPQVSDGVVEVLFVERLVRFYKMLDSVNNRIPLTFLDDLLVECCEKWQPQFPGLEVDHLIARAVPRIPLTGCTFRDWGGTVLVELKDERVDVGLIPQLSESKAEVNLAKMSVMEIIKKMDEKVDEKVEIANKLVHKLLKKQATTQEDMQKKVEDFQKKVEDFQKSQEEFNEQLKRKQEELKTKQEELAFAHEELVFAHEELKKHVLLTNHLKQRMVLERARVKIIHQLGKPTLQGGQKWKDFFESF